MPAASSLFKTSTSRPRLRIFFLAAAVLPILLLAQSTALAGSATWNLAPGSGDWNTDANWIPMSTPNGPDDTATFDLSTTTAISLSVNTEVNTIVFNLDASTINGISQSTYQGVPGTGYHYLQWIEFGSTGTTFLGDNSGNEQSALIVIIDG